MSTDSDDQALSNAWAPSPRGKKPPTPCPKLRIVSSPATPTSGGDTLVYAVSDESTSSPGFGRAVLNYAVERQADVDPLAVVGYVVIKLHPGGKTGYAQAVAVPPHLRRLGIATAMYRYVENKLGVALVAGAQTKMGKQMWKSQKWRRDEGLLRGFIRLLLEGQETFDLEVLRKMTDVFEIEDYLSTYDPRAREGAGRSVYDVGKGFVVKLARPYTDGAKQNKREAQLSKCASPGAPIVAVLEVGPGFKWITCTKVEPIVGQRLSAALKATVGLTSAQGLIEVVEAGTYELTASADDDAAAVAKHHELYRTNEWYEALFDTVTSCKLNPSELHDGNWGLDEDGDLVLLDAGG